MAKSNDIHTGVFILSLQDALLVGGFIGLTITLIGLLPEIPIDEDGDEIFDDQPRPKDDKVRARDLKP